ncbi:MULTISPECIES: aminoacyl-tRNA deacylase [unclassified Salinibacterium]|uniref:aminoacyl-tRNA deacylase n=1 Tax=unclassified Salinibacterium TaxID=2632331 RepID=UPI0018CE6F5A|nr:MULTISPECIES: YbaK/EbsC family protein [unclassified Salinibacterium]MBH0054010.1 YbaK/EbsC family protein [Salinibacterium sp. SWN139]MBH0083292.1 YbaK/EbsC family protein [Salinibacterium sp. SWN167]
MTAGTDRVRDDAERRGIPIEIVERAPATSLEHAAELLGITPAEIVKSLVVKRSDGSYLFALVPGDRQISWPKLRAVVGVNKLRMPEAALALEATGFARGTITPLGSSTAWPVFADERIAGKRVSMGSGDHGYTTWVNANDLITGLEATVADITSETGTD